MKKILQESIVGFLFSFFVSCIFYFLFLIILKEVSNYVRYVDDYMAAYFGFPYYSHFPGSPTEIKNSVLFISILIYWYFITFFIIYKRNR